MDIQTIKSRLSLSEVIRHYGYKADKSGRICCPFHDDSTPSMQLYYKTHTAYCFSSNCTTHGKSMDVIDFIMYREGCSKHEALVKATAMVSGTASPAAELTKTAILTKMFTYFTNAVYNSPPAKEYIAQRGLDYQILATGGTPVGYNSGQFHHGNRRDDQLIKSCVEIGLLSLHDRLGRSGETSYKPFAKNCIVFALRNKTGQVSGLYFRSTINNEASRHFYLKDRAGLYPRYPHVNTKKLILTESIIDAATLLQHPKILQQVFGKEPVSVLALYGTNGLTQEHTTAIRELNQLNEIIFFLNGDDPGRAAVRTHKETLHKLLLPLRAGQAPITISHVEPPQGEDVNSLSLGHKPEIFVELLQGRVREDKLPERHAQLPEQHAQLPEQHAQEGHAFFLSTEKKEIYSDEKKEAISDEEKTNLSTEAKPTESSLEIAVHGEIHWGGSVARYQVLGGINGTSESLKVTLAIVHPIGQKSRHKVDLYEDRQLSRTAKEAAQKLGLTVEGISADLEQLTDLLEDYRRKTEQQKQHQPEAKASYQMSQWQKDQALTLARSADLMAQLESLLTQSGVVGEPQSKVFLFVIAASHIQQNPLNALIQGSSGSGKTRLLKQIYACMPEENKKIYSRLSEKMLFNVPRYYFQNKLVCFEDVDGLGEEAEYAWRELVSNGVLISGVSYKDQSGNIGVKELIVYGPIASIACTTKGAIYADNMSRLFLIAIDESGEQTRCINDYQAREAAGLIDHREQRQATVQLQNYVRLLLPYRVYNPHALHLRLPSGIRDERRLYRLYLYFIDMVTILHQHQREKTDDNRLVATAEDCQIAKDLMFECMMLKMDELEGSLRQFFERLKDYLQRRSVTSTEDVSQSEFTQREIRQMLHYRKTALSYYINELVELEYLQQVSRGGNKGHVYRIGHWDNYRKLRSSVKDSLQQQIDRLKSPLTVTTSETRQMNGIEQTMNAG